VSVILPDYWWDWRLANTSKTTRNTSASSLVKAFCYVSMISACVLQLNPWGGSFTRKSRFTAPAADYSLETYRIVTWEIKERVNQETTLTFLKIAILGSTMFALFSLVKSERYETYIQRHRAAVFFSAALLASGMIDARLRFNTKMLEILGEWIKRAEALHDASFLDYQSSQTFPQRELLRSFPSLVTVLLYASMVYAFVILPRKGDEGALRVVGAGALFMFATLTLIGFTYEGHLWAISLTIARIGFGALFFALILKRDGAPRVAERFLRLMRGLGLGWAENLVMRSNSQAMQGEISDGFLAVGWNKLGTEHETKVVVITDGRTTDEMSRTKTADTEVTADADQAKGDKTGAVDMGQEGEEHAEGFRTDKYPYCLDTGCTEYAMTQQPFPDTAGKGSVIHSVECKEQRMNTPLKETVREIRERLAALGTQMVCVVVDAMFLTLWLVVQWVMDHWILPHFRLTDFHNRLILVYQIIFAIATLVPIVAYVIVDLLSIYLKARRAMKEKMNYG